MLKTLRSLQWSMVGLAVVVLFHPLTRNADANDGVEGQHQCGVDRNHTHCDNDDQICCSGKHGDGRDRYFCEPIRDGCPG